MKNMATIAAGILALTPTANVSANACGPSNTHQPLKPVADLERLVIAEEIRNLKARYFRCVDTRQKDCVDTIFSSGAVFEIGADPKTGGEPSRYVIEKGVDMKGQLDALQTIHHGFIPEITILSSDAACAIWPMEGLQWDTSTDDKKPKQIAYGYYYDEYRKIGNLWLIQNSTLIRLRVDIR